MPRPTNEEKNCPVCGNPRTALYERRARKQVFFGWNCKNCKTITEAPTDENKNLTELYKWVE